MKKFHVFLPLVCALATTSSIYSTVDQDFDAKLNTIQNLLVTVIQQSNIDPQTAQDLLDKTNELNQYVQNNIQQNAQDIRVAAAFTSLIETADTMAQNAKFTQVHTLLKNIKYAGRANVIEKLVTGMYPEKFSNEAYYTDPYIESIGFIANNWAINIILSSLLTKLAATSLGSSLQLSSTSGHQKMIARIVAGIATHYAWLAEKEFAFAQLNPQS